MITNGENRRRIPGKTLADTITDALRGGILQGALHPGEHLCQHALTQEYLTSKVPVREALMQLHMEGLLRYDRNRGYFVMRISLGEAQQIYKVRRWIEAELLQTLQWPALSALEQFAELQGRVSNTDERAERAVWYDALVRSRQMLFGFSPDTVLLREVSRLWVRMDHLHAFFPPEGCYAVTESLATHDRALLLECHAAERDRAEELLAEAQVALPDLWAPGSQTGTRDQVSAWR